MKYHATSVVRCIKCPAPTSGILSFYDANGTTRFPIKSRDNKIGNFISKKVTEAVDKMGS